MFFKKSTDTHQRARGAKASNKVRDLWAVTPHFGPSGFIMHAGVGFVGVLMQKAPLRMLSSHGFGTTHGAIRAFSTWCHDDFGTEHLEHLTTFNRHTFGHQNGDGVTRDARDCGQRNASVARRWFENSLTFDEPPRGVGPLDHCIGDAIFN